MVQSRPRRLLFHDEGVRLPLAVFFRRHGLQLGELQTRFDRVQQDDVVLPLLLVIKHTPRGQGREVSTVVGFRSGVESHDDVLHLRRRLARPDAPPLSLDDGGLLARRILLVLGVPLEHGHGCLGPQQRRQVEKLGPESFLDDTDAPRVGVGLLDIQYRRELDHLVLVRPLILGHIADNAPGEVIHVPTCLDDSYSATRHQTRPGTVGEPLVGFLEYLEVAVQYVLFGVRVVNQQQVGTATRDTGANTAGEVLAPKVRVPPPCGLAVRRQRHRREDVLVGFHVDQVADLATKVHGEVRGVRHHHDLLARIPPDEPCREVDGDKLRLTVARRDVHADAILAILSVCTSFDSHQLIGQNAVVPPNLVVGVHVEAEGDQVVVGRLALLACRQLVHEFV